MLADGVSLLCLAVETGREFIKVVVRSAMVPKAAKVSVPLWRQATGSPKAKLQLEAYDDVGNLLIKSPVAEVEFLPSVNGVNHVSDTSNTSIVADIAANTAARHTHENAGVLGKIGESNGVPTYNGQPFASRKTKTAVYDCSNGESYSFTETTGMRKALLYIDNDVAETPIAEGTEILSVEMHFSSGSFPEWVSVDNMDAFDPKIPHIVNHKTAFFESSFGALCVASLFFPTAGSVFYTALQSGFLDKIRVTFVDNEE